MGEEVPDAARDRIAAEGFGGYGRGRVSNWEVGLPTEYELFPLTKPLVSPGLAADFRIGPQPSRTAVDVDREVQKTINNLRSTFPSPVSASLLRYFVPSQSPVENNDEGGEEEEDVEEERSDAVVPCVNYGIKSPHPKRRRIEALSILRTENSNDGRPARSQKRPRVVWKPQLRKLFVDVATRVGTKNAVPKTIMQLMNVEGLTRENVASHLQKYRIYLRSKEGLSNEGPSSSDCAFASTLVPQSLQEHHHQLPQTPPQTVPLPYTMLTILPMPVYSVPHGNPRSRCPSLKATRWVGISMDLRLLIIQELLGSDRWIGELV